MPLLPTYSASKAELPISGGRRASAEEMAGPDLGAFAKTGAKAAESYLQDTEDRETRSALVAASQIRAKYANELDAATLDGRDLAPLKEQMQADLSKVGDGFQTRKGQESLSVYQANGALMFDEQANRVKVQRAAADAERDGHAFLNSQAAVLRSNPLALPMAEKDAESLAATFTGIPAHMRTKIEDGLKKELNMAAALAATRIDPEGTKKRLSDGEWNLTPQQRETATGHADAEIRSKRAEESYQRSLAEFNAKKADEAARGGHFGRIIDGTATRRQIMDDADLHENTREHLIVFMEQRAQAIKGQEKRSDQTVVKDLWLRIHAPETDPRKIYNGDAIFDAVTAGSLNTEDANRLNVLVANQKDENNRAFGTRLQGRINVIAGVMRTSPEYQAQPELASAIQLEIISRAETAAKEIRKAGRSPDGMLDPTSKDNFFTPGLIKSVANDVKQRERDLKPVLPVVNSQADYDALDDKTTYVDSNGVQGVKRGAKKTTVPGAAPIVPASAQSYYEENRAKHGPEATKSFDRLMDLLSGKPPTRESTEDYDRRKTGL